MSTIALTMGTVVEETPTKTWKGYQNGNFFRIIAIIIEVRTQNFITTGVVVTQITMVVFFRTMGVVHITMLVTRLTAVVTIIVRVIASSTAVTDKILIISGITITISISSIVTIGSAAKQITF